MKKIILFLVICANLYQINANNTIKKETLLSRVSFLIQKNDSLYSSIYSKINRLYQEEDYVKALEKAFILNDLCKENDDTYWSYKTLYLIANIYNNTNKFNKSLEYYKESLVLVEILVSEQNDSRISEMNYAYTLLKIGSSYHKLSVANEESNKFYYLDSAKSYYKKVVNLPKFNKKLETLKSKAFNNLSGIYESDSLFDIAENYIKKSIKIHEKHYNNIGVASAMNNLGNISLSQKKYEKAKKFYLDGINLIRNDKSSKATSVRANLCFNLAWAMRNLKDYKAYDWQEKFYDIQDTIREKELRGIIEQMTYKYDFDGQKKLFDKEQEVIILKEKDKTRTIVAVAVFLLILLLFVIGYYVYRQNNLQLKLTKSELLQNQSLDRLKSESQARILDATLNGREKERKEIAETLHDSVSAMLSSANLHLQATRKRFENGVPIEIIKTQEIITETSKSIRDLSHTLVSSVLLKFGLDLAISDIAVKYSNSELIIETEFEGLRRYKQEFEIKTYNIIQEFINNILKHSKAKKAIIKLKEENGLLLIEVSDDGVGFNKTEITIKDGLGINQIEARIHMMKGKFNVSSKKGKGTQINVELPVQEKEEINLF